MWTVEFLWEGAGQTTQFSSPIPARCAVGAILPRTSQWNCISHSETTLQGRKSVALISLSTFTVSRRSLLKLTYIFLKIKKKSRDEFSKPPVGFPATKGICTWQQLIVISFRQFKTSLKALLCVHTLFTWLCGFVLESCPFTLQQWNVTEAHVCVPSPWTGCLCKVKGLACVCLCAYPVCSCNGVFVLVQIILMSCPVGLSKRVVLSWRSPFNYKHSDKSRKKMAVESKPLSRTRSQKLREHVRVEKAKGGR